MHVLNVDLFFMSVVVFVISSVLPCSVLSEPIHTGDRGSGPGDRGPGGHVTLRVSGVSKKAMTVNFRGCVAHPKVFPLRSVTWDNKLI